MTESIYTDEMIEACAHAAHEAHRAALPSRLSLLNLPWEITSEDVHNLRRSDVRAALSGDEDCALCIAVSHAVARAMGWPRKP